MKQRKKMPTKICRRHFQLCFLPLSFANGKQRPRRQFCSSIWGQQELRICEMDNENIFNTHIPTFMIQLGEPLNYLFHSI